MDKFFEVCSRVFIIKDGKILLCKRKEADYFFFPGGHIDFSEKAEEALIREIQEEIGKPLSNLKFIGANENYFNQNGDAHHEFALVFSGEIPDGEVKALEEYLEFSWVNLDSLDRENIKPIALKNELKKWLNEKENFWSSQF